MKFEMEQRVLEEMAGKVKKIVNNSISAEILRGVYLECDEEKQEVSMIGTDTDMSIFLKERADVRESGRIVLDARLLFDIISHAPDGRVRFLMNRQKSMVRIKTEKTVYDIIFFDAKNYPKPEMPFPEDTVRISGIRSMAARTAFAVDEDSENIALGCVCLRTHKNRMQAAATNGRCMMLAKQDIGCGSEKQFLLPKKQFLKLAAMSADEDEYSVGEIHNRVVFMKKGMMVSLETYRDVSFLDTDRVVQAVQPEYTATVEARDMKRALDLMSADKENMTVNIVFRKNTIVVSSGGKYPAETQLPAKTGTETPKGGFYYSLKELCSLFRVIHGIAQIKTDRNGATLIRSKDELFFLMPRRPIETAKKTNTKKAA